MSEDETVDAMMAVAATWRTGATPELMREWLAESAERDAEGTFRNPMPHENWCPEFDHSRPCSRQEGHTGGHSTQY